MSSNYVQQEAILLTRIDLNQNCKYEWASKSYIIAGSLLWNNKFHTYFMDEPKKVLILMSTRETISDAIFDIEALRFHLLNPVSSSMEAVLHVIESHIRPKSRECVYGSSEGKSEMLPIDVIAHLGNVVDVFLGTLIEMPIVTPLEYYDEEE